MKKKLIIALLLITSFAYSQNKQDTSVYYLLGRMPDFYLLYKAVISPQDITPREDSMLVHWIRAAQKLPTMPPPIQKPKQDSISKAKK